MANLIAAIKADIIEIIPSLIYFCVAFNLIHFTNGLAFRAEHISYLSYGTVTLGSIIVCKVLFIINRFSFVNAFPEKPVIYNVVWRFVLYGIATFIFVIVERSVELYLKYHRFDVIQDKVIDDFTSPFFWSNVLWVLWVFLIYILFNQFIVAMGRKKVWTLFFGG